MWTTITTEDGGKVQVGPFRGTNMFSVRTDSENEQGLEVALWPDEASDLLAALLGMGVPINENARRYIKNSEEFS